MKTKTTLRRSLLLAAGSSLLAGSFAHAASGTWNGISGNWSDTTNPGGVWSGGTVADGLDSTANFTGVDITADQIINLDAVRTIGNITFTDLTTASNNLTISGANILTLDRSSGAPVIDVTQTGRTLTISSQISGADGLQKNGTGTLSLSGDNNYTGTTVISNGILAISSNNALGSSAAGSNQTTIAATGSSTGPQLSLSGGITSPEPITLTGNTEQNQYLGVINNTSGSNTLSGNITLASPSGSIRLSSSGGELIFSGTISQTGTTRELILSTSGGSFTVNNAIANNGGGLGIVSQGGSGSVTLKAAPGTGIGAVSIRERGLLKLGVNNAIRTDQNFTIGEPWNYTGSDQGTFDLAGFNQTVKALVGNKNTSNVGADSTRIVTNSATGTSTLTVGNGNGSGTFNGVIQDGGAGKIVALTKTGTGTQTLVGDSNYSGVTTISAGFITITHANALGSTAGNTTIAATGSNTGGVLQLSGGITTAENISITGTTEAGSYFGAIRSTSGNNTVSGNITLASPSNGIRLEAAGGNLTFSGNISQTGTTRNLVLEAEASRTLTVDNAIANNGGSLLIDQPGTVILKGVSGGGIGDAFMFGGTLKLGVADALNTTRPLELYTDGSPAPTFDLAGFNQTINALRSGGTGATANRKVINSVAGTKTLTVGNGGGSGTFNGQINTGTGNIQLIKTGAGNQTLSGNNSFTGGTRIDNGTLTLGHATNTLADTGAVNVNGGTLALGTNTDTVGAVTLTSGSITGSGAGTLTGTGSAFDVRSGTISAKLGGTVGLTKTTAGTVTISSDNSVGGYSGTTTVSEGTLVVSGAGSINSTSAINVAAGGTLRYNSSAALTVAPSLNGTGTGASQRAVLGGTGLINVGITLDNPGDVLSPGNSPGFQDYAVGQIWNSFSYDWEVNNFTGTTAGTDFDQIAINGGLTLTGAAANSYYLNVLSLTDLNVAGDAQNFSEINGSWTILTTTTGIGGFNSSYWNIDTTNFTNPDTGTWALTQSGNNLVLSYTVVPEAGTAGLLALGLLLLRRLRRRAARA